MVLEKIIKMVEEQFMVEAGTVTEATAFVDDLSADSLDVVEMIMELENEYGVEFDLENQNIASFKELADFIESKLN